MLSCEEVKTAAARPGKYKTQILRFEDRILSGLTGYCPKTLRFAKSEACL